ncbi:M56 family metallopeptidase [Rheinheimera maricola]|uniref:M56 family metallopeptidase n=1 Tax=Rheinheimera maricola TaxID=2793282 RepID=A0ABS7XA01_9GAMM|nr:M56 family metallopeptidase [Rheinheimera maricola]MBZ9612385.1 M56 family metallopeptidase [Rheinheimera maricola]
MFEYSWLLSYLLLHVGLAVMTIPWLYWLSASQWQSSPQLMLRLWTSLTVILFILPLLILMLSADDKAESSLFSTDLARLQVKSEYQTERQNVTLAAVEPTTEIIQRWALTPQLLYLLTPPLWLLWLLPMLCLRQCYRFCQSYWVSRQLWCQAEDCSLVGYTARLPGVYQHGAISSAMLLGLRHPRILLPSSWLKSLSAEQLQHVIAHEHMHWQRGDLLGFYLQQLVGILCCWSPFWRLLCRQLDRYRELSCDAAVVASLLQPHRYAQTLLDCSRTMARPTTATLAMPWQQQPLLAQRVSAVLQGAGGRATARNMITVTALSAVLLLAFALTQQWQVTQLPKQYGLIKLSELKQLDELLGSIKQHDIATVRRLIAQGYPINQAMPGQGTPLMVAVRQENATVVAVLLQAGADVNASSRGDGNALIIAVQRRNLKLVQQLVQAGADVNAIVLADETPLINASYVGDLQMVQYLVSMGANVNLQVEATLMDGRELRSALSRAATEEMRTYLRHQGALQ